MLDYDAKNRQELSLMAHEVRMVRSSDSEQCFDLTELFALLNSWFCIFWYLYFSEGKCIRDEFQFKDTTGNSARMSNDSLFMNAKKMERKNIFIKASLPEWTHIVVPKRIKVGTLMTLCCIFGVGGIFMGLCVVSYWLRWENWVKERNNLVKKWARGWWGKKNEIKIEVGRGW